MGVRVLFITIPDMPAKAMLFDQRVRTLHDFGAAPINTISFSPHGRLVLLAGYGNLAGKTDIYDRRTLNKACTLDAPNSTHVEWPPDGRFIMTAILSPRSRVDNGVKVWHCSGVLVQPCEELYQVRWRPAPVDLVPAFPGVVPAAPAPSKSVAEAAVGVGGVGGAGEEKTGVVKVQGAYRPPGARGTATPAIFKREDEVGVARTIGGGSGTATPPRVYHNRTPPGGYHNGNGGYHQQHQHQHANGGRRHVRVRRRSTSSSSRRDRYRDRGGQHPNHQGQGQGQDGERKKGREEAGEEGRTVNGNGNRVDVQVVVRRCGGWVGLMNGMWLVFELFFFSFLCCRVYNIRCMYDDGVNRDWSWGLCVV